MDLTYKKRHFMRPNKTNPTSRRPGAGGVGNKVGAIPRSSFPFDESAAKTNMTRLRSRGPRRERLVGSCPLGHWRTTTMISAIRVDGSTACMTIDGETDTAVFQAYVREVLCPTLRRGDVVVMDNLAPHKNEPTVARFAATVRSCPITHRTSLPAEMMWNKGKASLRAAEARTHPELLVAISEAQNRVNAQDAVNCFAACGYNVI